MPKIVTKQRPAPKVPEHAIGSLFPGSSLTSKLEQTARAFTAEYVVCANRVQVVWFKTEEARSAEHQLHSDSAQPPTIIEGENWMVVDMSEARNEAPSGKDLKALARELGGAFRYVNGAESP